ncbi:hypothetical protein K440DRAFT_619006 [Wilcoxina mikolae CBS 423.85]|nr:hypothetical protein K440DRAFT_619006 [Wilcoxina mikolae CBS 423.85]
MGVECVGGDDKELSLYETTSLRILEGIERLENILRTQNAPPSSPAGTTLLRAPPGAAAVSPALSYQSTASIATAIYEPPSPIPAIHTLFDSTSTNQATGRMLKTPSKLDRILAWSVFPRTPFNCGLASDGNWRENPGEDVHLNPEHVRVLHMQYLERFHPCYPIINIDTLDKAVHSSFKGTQGCKWDSEACLMLLVCALGAISDDYRDHFYSKDSPTDSQRSRIERIAMAEGYWFMAQRRLGYVLSEESELSGQCLALAGFWYLYQLDPISAYKMFHSACLSWQTLHLAQGRTIDISGVEVDGVGLGMTHAQYLKQRLYWTCLKAEFELRAELSLPVPLGAQLEYPLHFPGPPASFGRNPGGAGYLDENRLWYFYTAEIFLRRLHNQVVEEVSSFEAHLHEPHISLTEKRLASLITIVREYEAYVSKWHTSLPSDIRFPDPAASPPLPLADERQQFIRKRFLDCHELLYRPFLNLFLNYPAWQGYIAAHPKSRSQPPDLGKLERDVRHFSMLALRYTYWSICADRGVWFHHSCAVWFDVRNRLADVLVLRAAANARLELPMGWEELVVEAENGLIYWCSADGEDQRAKDGRRRSGLQGCIDTLRWARDAIGP